MFLRKFCLGLLAFAILCPMSYAGENAQVNIPLTSNIRKFHPDQSPNSPADFQINPPLDENFGYEIGKSSINNVQTESELLAEYDLTSWIVPFDPFGNPPKLSFPGGVNVRQVRYANEHSIASSNYNLYETSVNPNLDSTWNNVPGPSPTIGNRMEIIPGTVGFVNVISLPIGPNSLASRIQQHIDAANNVLFRCVYTQTSFGQDAATSHPRFLITAYMNGDCNEDDVVNFADYLILAANFGQPGGWTEGDFDGNGVVDFGDFLKLSANFNLRLAD